MTLDQLRIGAERTRAEAKLNGSIQRIQLDNQMLVSSFSPPKRSHLKCACTHCVVFPNIALLPTELSCWAPLMAETCSNDCNPGTVS